MFKTILMGYDGSDTGRAALIEAARWARRWGSEMIALYAVYFDAEEFAIAPVQSEKRAAQGERICQEARTLLTKELGVDARFLIAQGEPPEEIVKAAEDHHADLVVLGTHGRKGLNRWIMGSVTSWVLTHASNRMSVLVVKKPCTECTGTYRSIVVPFDGSEASRHALETASRLSHEMGFELHVLYVIPRYEEMVGFIMTDAIRKNVRSEAERILTDATGIATSIGASVKTEIGEGAPVDEIRRVAREHEADLIVMGSHGYRGVERALLGSTAERMIIHSERPVLVVK